MAVTHQARPQRRGFTLVELLVVIGIIAILVALLLPALRRAREQAQAVTCMSNMRQVTLSVLIYTSQTGYFPYGAADLLGKTMTILVRNGTIPRGTARTVSLGLPYSPLTQSTNTFCPGVLRCPAGPDETAWPNNDPRNRTVWAKGRWRNTTTMWIRSDEGGDHQLSYNNWNGVVPTDNLKVFSHYITNAVYPGNWQAAGKTYGNVAGFPYKSAFSNVFASSTVNENPVSLGRVRRPSEKWMVLESGMLIYSPWYGAVFRHPLMSANFAYFDGHVERLLTTEIDGSTASTYGLTPPFTCVNDSRLLFDR